MPVTEALYCKRDTFTDRAKNNNTSNDSNSQISYDLVWSRNNHVSLHTFVNRVHLEKKYCSLTQKKKEKNGGVYLFAP